MMKPIRGHHITKVGETGWVDVEDIFCLFEDEVIEASSEIQDLIERTKDLLENIRNRIGGPDEIGSTTRANLIQVTGQLLVEIGRYNLALNSYDCYDEIQDRLGEEKE